MKARAAVFLLAMLAIGSTSAGHGAGKAATDRHGSPERAASRPAGTAAIPARADDPVHVVTSRETWLGIRDLARDPVEHVDRTGNRIVVSRVDAHRLGEVSDYVHQREHRCGGFFAFASRQAAEAAIRGDRSLEAMMAPLAPTYIDDAHRVIVEGWMTQVSEPGIRETIEDLSSFQNRYYKSPSGKEAAEWIRDRWQSLAGSRADVGVELFTACSTCATQPSVIMTVEGRELPGEIVVVGAHLDSINSSAGGDLSQVAPGADDDASGIATLTEVIRIALASGWEPKRTVMFMAYAAEEVGLRGSMAIAKTFREDNRNVVGVLQLDMTNYRSGPVSEVRLVNDFSNKDLRVFIGGVFDRYLAPKGYSLGTLACGYGCSDHASWTSQGYPAAMLFEAADGGTQLPSHFPKIHTAEDTLANMGGTADNSVVFAKLGLAFIGDLALFASNQF